MRIIPIDLKKKKKKHGIFVLLFVLKWSLALYHFWAAELEGR